MKESYAIETRHLTKRYGEQVAVNDVCLHVPKGHIYGLLGRNGAGKTSIMKLILQLMPATSGETLLFGEPVKRRERGVFQRIGAIIETPGFYPNLTGTENLEIFAKLRGTIRPDAVEHALQVVGLPYKDKKLFGEYSLGMKQRLGISNAIMHDPELLILDEPIAQLDPAHADRIYGVLRELNERYGKTIIVIEHHTEYIADFCKHVMLLKEGRVQWMLPTGEALQRVEELQSCNIFPPQVTLAAWRMRQAGSLTVPRLPATISEGREVFVPRADPASAPRPAVPAQGETVASFQDVSVAYRSVKGEPHKVFDGLSLAIHKGDKVALIGSNGAGKSTFMKLLVGLMKPSAGTVCLHGRSLRDVRPETLSREVSMVYQNPEDMFIKDSIRTDIAYAMEVRNVPEWEKRTAELLERFRLTELADRDGRLMSGGQMRRASLAIGVALDPGILLLDEPTANLDIATRKEIMRTLEDLKEITETVVIATHDMQLVCEWAQRIIVLCGGKVVADGTRDEIFGDRALIERVGIRPPEIFTMGQALDPAALCYTIDDFLRCFEGRKPV